MPNKELCKRCTVEFGYKWRPDDDEKWDKFQVFACVVEERYMKTETDPPPSCPYYLEHLLQFH